MIHCQLHGITIDNILCQSASESYIIYFSLGVLRDVYKGNCHGGCAIEAKNNCKGVYVYEFVNAYVLVAAY